ncbi:hypothetical protein IVB14_05185 [Bradyrhizobium sp. 180]|uniref:hypothetical protein n=1 Tax=unclassified Bradyrhizobium TaxID=2631580 RepID=UPI001FFAA133|nr:MULTISPECIES: hypothetical protein [unclassified Bradyrhizobium]MCK1420720.1 hypothetical protein [Bradyrhizobium sp. CW12]MCK1489831.1 hypothetical protein [Bradyrhizobium sp. 180]MCK1532385.1 hypothetical protein [Bradyrhizobium sp. 182]MCK1595651.1 hypothetical protein [Bradyrhizobium sp. 164]MCK1619572.1 hypothetical protein [Bradyrhizobium sp. 159]
MRHHFKPSSTSFEYRLDREATSLRKQAEGMPTSVRRDELLRKARQIDVAIEINAWVTSPGLQAPT